MIVGNTGMKNLIRALTRFVQNKWGKKRYITARVSFFEFMTTSPTALNAELQRNGFDLDRTIETTMADNQAAYIYKQELL